MPNLAKKGNKSSETRGARPKKRHMYFNPNEMEKDKSYTSASAQKLGAHNFNDIKVNPAHSYVIISFLQVFGFLSDILQCKLCQGAVKFERSAERGLGFKLVVSCECSTREVYSGPLVKKAYEINRRITFVMRLLGVGIAGLNTFVCLMDMGHRFSNFIYYAAVENILCASKSVWEVSQKLAVKEEVEENARAGNIPNHLSVSGDGSWKKRGFKSLFGVTSLIGKYSKKVLDFVVKSSFCYKCAQWKDGEKESEEYKNWLEDHKEECTKNHEGSAGRMEVDGIVEMFRRSLSLLGVYFAIYIGDGDIKTFKAVFEVSPYEDVVVVKKECVNHVQKRMGRHLREVKKKDKKNKNKEQEKESDNAEPTTNASGLRGKRGGRGTRGSTRGNRGRGARATKSRGGGSGPCETAATSLRGVRGRGGRVAKNSRGRGRGRGGTAAKTARKSNSLGGKGDGKLTDNLIKELTMYYGLAIRRNSHSIEDMIKAVWATFKHKISTNEKPQHEFCPEGAESWCSWRRAEADGTLATYEHKPALTPEVQEAIEPIYHALTERGLMERSTGANTQNSNECLNSCIWRLSPKHLHSGAKTVELACYIGCSTFNDGYHAILKIMELLGIQIGLDTRRYAERKQTCRINISDAQALAASKQARMEAAAKKRKQQELYEEEEGLLYGPGIDD